LPVAPLIFFGLSCPFVARRSGHVLTHVAPRDSRLGVAKRESPDSFF
jgi:hypothetical protein